MACQLNYQRMFSSLRIRKPLANEHISLSDDAADWQIGGIVARHGDVTVARRRLATNKDRRAPPNDQAAVSGWFHESTANGKMRRRIRRSAIYHGGWLSHDVDVSAHASRDNPSKWMLCGHWWKGPRRLYKVHVLRRDLVSFLCCWHSHGLPLN